MRGSYAIQVTSSVLYRTESIPPFFCKDESCVGAPHSAERGCKKHSFFTALLYIKIRERSPSFAVKITQTKTAFLPAFFVFLRLLRSHASASRIYFQNNCHPFFILWNEKYNGRRRFCDNAEEREKAMDEELTLRALRLGRYIAEKGATVRNAAKEFGISKSTVHKDVAERLEYINKPLFRRVRRVLDKNKEERHLRGGLATKEKYKRLKDIE